MNPCRLKTLFKWTATLALLPVWCAQAQTQDQGTSYFLEGSVPTEVQAAHAHFLRGELDQMLLSVKDAMAKYPQDSAIRSNLLELVKAAEKIAGNDGIGMDWHLPPGVTYLRVGVRRLNEPQAGRARYRMGLSVDIATGVEMEQLQLIRFPDEVVLDKKAGIGDWGTGTAQGIPYIYASSPYQATPPNEGLYLLNVQVKGKEMIRGWLIVQNMVASESPKVNTPTMDQVYTTGNPSFTWDNFVSPEYQSQEKRKITLAVIERKPDVHSNTWERSIQDMSKLSATVGIVEPGDVGPTVLPDGSYNFQVTYSEKQRMGDIVVARECSTRIPFTVRAH